MREILGWIGVAVLVLAAAIGYVAFFATMCKWATDSTNDTMTRRGANVIAIVMLLAPFVALAVWGLG